MFIIGSANNKAKIVELKKEVAQFDDFMLIDIEEYSKLLYKMLAFFKVIYAFSDFEFFVKVDADI